MRVTAAPLLIAALLERQGTFFDSIVTIAAILRM
jgi:hypothetical protein